MPYVQAQGKKVFCAAHRGGKDGPTLTLIHGAGGSHLHWPTQLRRLPGATVYTLDLPGHGRSEGRGCDTIAGYAQTVVAFHDALGSEQAIIVGHSMGGAIAQTLALDYPDRVTGLVLVATGARLRVAPAILEGIRNDLAGTADLITRFAWSPEAPPTLTQLGKEALLKTGAAVLLRDFVACDNFDVMERLEDIQAPTLVVAGTVDQLTPLKYAHFLAQRIPAARLAVIEKAGHMVMLERPAEVGKAVQGFLEEIGAA